MSEIQYYKEVKPIDNVENFDEENQLAENQNPIDDVVSQQELTSPVIPNDYTDDQLEQLEDTIVNKTQENELIPLNEEAIQEVPNVPSMEPGASFFDREESEKFKKLWMDIQGKFVDEPRVAVQKADDLISDMIKQIADDV